MCAADFVHVLGAGWRVHERNKWKEEGGFGAVAGKEERERRREEEGEERRGKRKEERGERREEKGRAADVLR